VKYFRIDRNVAGAGDVHVGRAGFVAKAHGNLLWNAPAPVKCDRLQFRDEADVVLKWKCLRYDRTISAKVHRHAVCTR